MIHATGNVSVAGSHKRWKDLKKGANCVLLIHSDTTDASTTIVDSIGTHSPSAQGNTQHDTAQKKFGATSILFDGNGDYITIPDHANWTMSNTPFTIDCWVRFSSVPAGTVGIFSQYEDADNHVEFQYVGSDPKLSFQVYNPGLIIDVSSAAWTPVVDTWYHIALIRGWNGGNNSFAITINGVQSGTTVTDTSAWPALVGAFEIGTKANHSGYWFPGWIDEFRVVNGVAMWTQSFFPPIGRYI